MPDSHSTIRAALVGAGLMGRWHAYSLVRAGGRLVAVADVKADLAARLAGAFRARPFSSLDELLDQVHPDVLHICTPPATHVEFATRGLEAGTHVLVEKPIAPYAESAARLVDLADAHNRCIMPVHQFIYQRGITRALERLSALAPLVHMEMTTVTAGGMNFTLGERDQLAADLLPHALSLFYRFLPGGLDAVSWLVQHPAPGELRALGRSAHVSVEIRLSTAGRPPRNTFTVWGEHGSAYVDLFHDMVVFENGGVSRSQKILRPFGFAAQIASAGTWNLLGRAWRGEVAYPGLRALIRAFYESIRQGTPAPITREEVYAIARARDQLISDSGLLCSKDE